MSSLHNNYYYIFTFSMYTELYFIRIDSVIPTSFPWPSLAVRLSTASDKKLGVGIGTKLALFHVQLCRNGVNVGLSILGSFPGPHAKQNFHILRVGLGTRL